MRQVEINQRTLSTCGLYRQHVLLNHFFIIFKFYEWVILKTLGQIILTCFTLLYYTFSRMSRTMKTMPSIASQRLISWQLLNIPGTTVTKAEPRNFSPRIILICEKIIVVAAAEQKPEITGPEMKFITKPSNRKNFVARNHTQLTLYSIRIPKLKRPAINSTHPARKDRTIA